MQEPYFHDPSEVPGNVAREKYAVRVAFLRRVQVGYALTVATAVGLGIPDFGGTATVWASIALAGLIALTLVRRFAQGRGWDGPVSLGLLAPTLLALGQSCRLAHADGWPVWLLLVAAGLAVAYALLCGRDYSTLGQFILSFSALGAVVAVAYWQDWIVPGREFFGFAGAAGFLLYLVYDLSVIVRRRRPDESPAAVADLYRDLLNLLTYPVRVALHWRRFRFI